MAQKVVTVYEDDLTGVESDQVSTHRFSLNGVNWAVSHTKK
ncbi:MULTISPECIES: hypothetical protein [unclassified Streptomyces]